MGAKQAAFLKSINFDPDEIDKDHVKKIFERYDKNKDGELDGDEVRQFLIERCGTNSFKHIERLKSQLMENFSVKKNGKLTLLELVK